MCPLDNADRPPTESSCPASGYRVVGLVPGGDLERPGRTKSTEHGVSTRRRPPEDWARPLGMPTATWWPRLGPECRARLSPTRVAASRPHPLLRPDTRWRERPRSPSVARGGVATARTMSIPDDFNCGQWRSFGSGLFHRTRVGRARAEREATNVPRGENHGTVRSGAPPGSPSRLSGGGFGTASVLAWKPWCSSPTVLAIPGQADRPRSHGRAAPWLPSTPSHSGSFRSSALRDRS